MNKIKENEDKEFVIKWIPSHIGISGNEKADEAAKKGVAASDIFYNQIALQECYGLLKKKELQRWQEEFNNSTVNKGLYYKAVAGNVVQKRTWFQKIHLFSGNVKIINRLKTGHAYDKKYLKLIKKEENDICDSCSVTETAEHIISNCNKWDGIRSNYSILINKNLKDILKENKKEELIDVIKFIKKIKTKL